MEHCDFVALKNMLVRYYMLDLLDTTNNVHYENYRCRKLTGIGPTTDNKKPLKDANKWVLKLKEKRKAYEIKESSNNFIWNPKAQGNKVLNTLWLFVE